MSRGRSVASLWIRQSRKYTDVPLLLVVNKTDIMKPDWHHPWLELCVEHDMAYIMGSAIYDTQQQWMRRFKPFLLQARKKQEYDGTITTRSLEERPTGPGTAFRVLWLMKTLFLVGGGGVGGPGDRLGDRRSDGRGKSCLRIHDDFAFLDTPTLSSFATDFFTEHPLAPRTKRRSGEVSAGVSAREVSDDGFFEEFLESNNPFIRDTVVDINF